MKSVSAWKEVIEFIINGLWKVLKINDLPPLNLSTLIIGITAIIIILIIIGVTKIRGK